MDSEGRHKASLGAGLTQGNGAIMLTMTRGDLVRRLGKNVHICPT